MGINQRKIEPANRLLSNQTNMRVSSRPIFLGGSFFLCQQPMVGPCFHFSKANDCPHPRSPRRSTPVARSATGPGCGGRHDGRRRPYTRVCQSGWADRPSHRSLDRDPSAVERIELPENVTAVAANFADTPEVLNRLEITAVDGIFLDLGLSSDQLAADDRGFSFNATGSLDLRFDQTAGQPAWELLEELNEKDLADLIFEFGEERLSRRIARKIVEQRSTRPIRSAAELAELLRSCVPRSKNHSIDPATRTFQALRIAVNEELKWLKVSLERLPNCLRPGGRLGIISFHSLEDRMVKHDFRNNDLLKVETKKPILPSELEVYENPRSRSAKLRFATRS